MARDDWLDWRETFPGRLFFLALAIGAFAVAAPALQDNRGLAIVCLTAGIVGGGLTVLIARRRAARRTPKPTQALRKYAFPIVAFAVVISAQLGSATEYVMLVAGGFMLCAAMALPRTSFRTWSEIRSRGQR